MATVAREIADQVKARNGYGDSVRIVRIVEYDNAWGGVGYGLEYEGQLGKYRASEFVGNPRVYWQADE